MPDRKITAAQIRYLSSLGVPASESQRWTRRQASNEISLRQATRGRPVAPVGPPLNGDIQAAPLQPEFRLAISRGLTAPGWC